MKANELMIGDWVKVLEENGVPGKVEGIYGLILVTQYGDDGDVALIEVYPIPITAEILEKNGWVKEQVKNSGCYFMNKTPDENTRLSWTDYCGAVLYQNEHHLCDCKYVHVLQHALRLIGHDELADNFKV